jgi:hypothetical protein
MEELFRFLLLRPATAVTPDDVNQLVPSFVARGTPRRDAQQKASAFAATLGFVNQGVRLQYSGAALQVVAALRSGDLPAAQISTIVQTATGRTAAQLAADAGFLKEQASIVDTLSAMKLLSDSSGGDAPGLAEIEQGYDAIALAAAGRDPVGLRVLSLDGFAAAHGAYFGRSTERWSNYSVHKRIFSPSGRRFSHEPQYALLDTRISGMTNKYRMPRRAHNASLGGPRLILSAQAKLEGQSWDVQRMCMTGVQSSRVGEAERDVRPWQLRHNQHERGILRKVSVA